MSELFPPLFAPRPMTREQGDLIASRLADIHLLLDRLVKLAEAREQRECPTEQATESETP